MESIISLSLSLARSLVKMMMTTQCPLEATYHFFFLSFISVLGCLTRAGALLKGTHQHCPGAFGPGSYPVSSLGSLPKSATASVETGI